MPKIRRGNLSSRIATLEREAELAHVNDARPQVNIYMPRKDGNTQPCGVISEARWFQMTLYDAEPQNAFP